MNYLHLVSIPILDFIMYDGIVCKCDVNNCSFLFKFGAVCDT